MAYHAGQRQSLISENMANSDTPGFKARDLVPFAESLSGGPDDAALRATRPRHLHATDGPFRADEDGRAMRLTDGQNAVSIEEEMVKAVETKRQHDRALAIYRSSLTILRASLGRS